MSDCIHPQSLVPEQKNVGIQTDTDMLAGENCTGSARCVYVAVSFSQLYYETYVLGTYNTRYEAIQRLHDVAAPHTITKLNDGAENVYKCPAKTKLMWVKTLTLGHVDDCKIYINQP